MTEDDNARYRVGYAIKRAYQEQRAALDNALRDLGVTTPQWAVMLRLRDHAGISNADLARLNCCTPQTMNDIVRHLEATGLVERERHPTHGIVLPTRLTPAGEHLLDECTRRIDAVQREMLAGFSEEECRSVAAALDRCVAALQAREETAAATR